VNPQRTIIIAGAGIGGLTAALALAQRGFRALVFDQAERLEETGAGIQLSPNATRVLIALGLGERLKLAVLTPQAVHILRARSGAEILRMPLGSAAEARYGAPYWMIHRGDLQNVLFEAAREHPDVEIKLGIRIETFAPHSAGVTVQGMRGRMPVDAQGIAFIGADGLWSAARAVFADRDKPQFAKRVAWRAVVPADAVAEVFREPAIRLWLGPRGHLVHYPVKGGRAVNIVAITASDKAQSGWSTESTPTEVAQHFGPKAWCDAARSIIHAPERWLRWALFDRPPIRIWGEGRSTLLGDAAHPMLPFMAQGAAMAIEDAAVLAECLAAHPEAPVTAIRNYEGKRRKRTADMQRTARRNGTFYHYYGPDAFARDLALKLIGGRRLLNRYDWIFDWRPS
jgi:salicylate hydroxylase